MKIGWILWGDKTVASARIQGWNVHDLFVNKGINSKIIFAPKGFQTELKLSKKEIDNILNKNYECIVLQKIQKGKNFFYLVKKAKEKGTKLLYIGVDSINIDFASSCDAILTITDYLKKKIPKKYQKKTFLVFDGYEQSKGVIKKHNSSKELNLIFVSNDIYSKFPQIKSLPKNVSLTILGPPRKRAKKWNPNKTIFTKTPHKFKYIVWKLKTIEKEILKYDVAVIPFPKEDLKEDYIKTKSTNRLIMFMAMGLPVIASPIPSYKKIIKQGKNGFIAKDSKDWERLLKYLKNNPKKRKEIGLEARKDVINKYSLEKQGELYLGIIKKVLKVPKINKKNLRE